jgi:hypothetical protein
VAYAAPRNPKPSTIVVGGLAFTGIFVGSVIYLTDVASYREWSAPLIALSLVIISMPLLSRIARVEKNPAIFNFLVFALIVKLAASAARHFLAFEVYDVADAIVYNREGTFIAEQFRAGNFDLSNLESLTDTDFVKLVTGVVYTIIGPTTWGGFIFFSWLGFWGAVCMHRAFVISLPGVETKLYDRLLFFLPSLLYWPSSIGKEAWMLFGLGIATLGCAKILAGSYRGGVPIAVIGLWATWVVRPHIAGFIGISLAAAVLFGKRDGAHAKIPGAAKAILAVVVIALAVVLTLKSTEFLQRSGVGESGGLIGTLEDVSDRTGAGDSRFTPPSLLSPLGLPSAVITVLFRPFIFEAHNAQVLVTAAESAIFMIFTLFRIKWIAAALRRARENPYVLFATVYIAASIVGLSSLANFGLLARQRVLLFPLLFILFVVTKEREAAADRRIPAYQKA